MIKEIIFVRFFLEMEEEFLWLVKYRVKFKILLSYLNIVDM